MSPPSEDQATEFATPQHVDDGGRMVIRNTGKGKDINVTEAASCGDTDANPTPNNLRVPPDPSTSPEDTTDTVDTKVCLVLVSEALKVRGANDLQPEANTREY